MAFDSAEGAARSTPAAPAPVSQRAESSGTGTNVQEAGVDEPDVVKTDGTTLYRVHDGTLTSYDVTGRRPGGWPTSTSAPSATPRSCSPATPWWRSAATAAATSGTTTGSAR